MTATVPVVRRKHRTIERPRLYALLDESGARVRTLVASAGYGKTTLAEQWVERDGRRGVWYTARSASTDVAALALGIARSAAAIVDGCDTRLREHLRALPAPAENVGVLAEILAEDMAPWPDEAWVVIDDYHEIAEEPKAERFVEALVSRSEVRFLISSRQRPAWVSTKMILYGDVLELNQTALAMDNVEAAEVLVGRSGASASGLVSVANGWPAVIGIASVSAAEIDADVEQLPESLYRYFAEEVFAALGREVQAGLTTLAVAPVLDRQLASGLLGPEVADSVCAVALDVGVLVERGPRLDLHPLARAFLEEWRGQIGLEPAAGAIDVCLEHYRAAREWDAAFEVLAREGETGELAGLLSAALDELLETARLSTVQRWCELGATASLGEPIFALARAEVMLRHGRHVEAMAHAEDAASRDPQLAFRSLSLAGRAAHLASREREALGFYRRAEEIAESESETRDAMWGQLACLIDLEDAVAATALEQTLSEAVSFADARDYVRAAALHVYAQLRFGSLDLDQADLASQLLSVVRDPLVKASFLSGYGVALALTARYREAWTAAQDLLSLAERSRLTFAIPHALCASSMALAGMRSWDAAETAARRALAQGRARRDVHVELLASSVLLRLLAQQARYREALRQELPSQRGALVASAAEFNCSRALLLACVGRNDEAMALVETAAETRAVEPVVLSAAVAAAIASRSGAPDAIDRVRRLEAVAFGVGALDLLVVAYRACPELLSVLLRSTDRARVEDLLLRAGDVDLAAAAGCAIAEDDDRTTLLSRREHEVYELLRTGLTNQQIAKLLYIEQSTVKAHVHHIYDKLGVRSRKALAIQAALERADQATSATDWGGSDTVV